MGVDQDNSPALKLSAKKRRQALFAQWFGMGIAHLIGKTNRVTILNKDAYENCRQRTGKPVIIALWHSALFPMLYWGRPGSWARPGICTVASRSADGRIIARIVRRLGYDVVHGSSSRGGTRVMVQLIRKLRAGVDVAVAVDGPKGPPLHAKPGVVLLAKMSGCSILPITACAKVHWRFRSWDRLRLPMPFNHVTLQAAEPIDVPADANEQTIESTRQQLQRTMLTLQEQLDHRVNPIVLRLPSKTLPSANDD